MEHATVDGPMPPGHGKRYAEVRECKVESKTGAVGSALQTYRLVRLRSSCPSTVAARRAVFGARRAASSAT
jgi:hypothetical protein